jgi:hypothetical protein
MSYKDDEEELGPVDIKEDEIDILVTEDLDDPLEDEILDDDLFVDDEEDLEEFAGLDGSTY